MRKITAHLFVEQKDINVNEMNELFKSAALTLRAHSENTHRQVVKSSKLKKVLFNAMKDEKSASVLIDEIDLEKSVYEICKLGEQVGNKLNASDYKETYSFLINTFMHNNDAHVEQTKMFLGMNLFITKIPDIENDQREKSDVLWKDNYIDMIFKDTENGYIMPLSIEIKDNGD